MDRAELSNPAESSAAHLDTDAPDRTAVSSQKVLVVYGTTEGQTGKIARYIAVQLTQRGHSLQVHEVAKRAPSPDPQRFDAVVIAASVHVGRYQPAIIDYAREHLSALESRPNAFVSVSLSAASKDEHDIAGLTRCVDAFIRETGWKPRIVHHAAGALRYSAYDFLKRWALQYIAFRRGAPTDTRRNHELTNWDDLMRFCDQLEQSFAASAATGR